MVFDIKMDLSRKARFVAINSQTQEPAGSKYAGVVSRESVRIALTYTALYDINVMAIDMLNAYLQAPTSEKFCVKCGPEFDSDDQGRKSSGCGFRNHLRDCMSHI